MALPSLLPPRYLHEMHEMAHTAPEGHFAELGVYKGGSAQVLYYVAQEQGRKLHLFDTFEGIPCKDLSLDGHNIGDFAPEAHDLAALHDAMPRAIYHVGSFKDTWPRTGIGPLAFVHVDADQYESTLLACRAFYPWLVREGKIIFDDYDHPPCRGVNAALEEFVRNETQEAMMHKSPAGRMLLYRKPSAYSTEPVASALRAAALRKSLEA